MIAPEYITDYLLEKFSKIGRIVSGGRELIIPSIFVENDPKMHMSINLGTGLWQCFKTSRRGNFYQLVSYLDDIPYKKAKAKIYVDSIIRTPKIECRIASINKEPTQVIDYTGELELSIPISPSMDLTEASKDVIDVYNYLRRRKLLNISKPDEIQFFFMPDMPATDKGKPGFQFRNRIIIPYFSEEREIVFFQARAKNKYGYPKYLNAGHCKASHILFPYDEEADHLVIVEGPTDCISLKNSGVNATCLNGAYVSDVQIDILKSFGGKIIVSLDNDPAGKEGLSRFEAARLKAIMPHFFVCSPPEKFKDWNEALCKLVPIKAYITKNCERYDWAYIINEQLNTSGG